MKNAIIACIGAAVLGFALCAAPAQQVSYTPATMPAATSSDSIQKWIEAVNTAPDPSAAVDAYVRGSAIDEKNVALTEAYIRRMLGFGMADMASRQAQTLLTTNPNNGLALAVSAFNSAQRGDMTTAFTSVSLAIRNSPDDPFAQAVAGQLVAWYDARPDRTGLTPGERAIADNLRQTLRDRSAYQSAYENSLAALTRTAGGGTAEAAMPTEQGQTYGPYAGAITEQPGDVTNNYYYYSEYPYPVYNEYSYPTYSGGPVFWGSPFFVPFTSSVFFFDVDFFRHHRFFDRDDFFFHHRFDRDRDDFRFHDRFVHRDRDDFRHGFANRRFGDRHDRFADRMSQRGSVGRNPALMGSSRGGGTMVRGRTMSAPGGGMRSAGGAEFRGGHAGGGSSGGHGGGHR